MPSIRIDRPYGKTPLPTFSVALACLLCGLLLATGCNQQTAKPQVATTENRSQRTRTEAPMTDEQRESVRPIVQAFCGDCHVTPQAHEFPIEDWPAEVARGFGFYRQSERTDLQVPDKRQITRFYQAKAPTRQEYYAALNASHGDRDAGSSLKLVTDQPRQESSKHWVADVHWDAELDGGRLVYADMQTGEIGAVDPRALNAEPTILGKVKFASHVEPCDLDQDGLRDYLVTDIGEQSVVDSTEGAVVWLRRVEADSLTFETIELAGGLSRPCDAREADFDGDGDLDVVVAEFGYRKTGKILWLENKGGETPAETKFHLHPVDARHGAVNTIPTDLDDDGDLDFVALIGQEFETITAFMNDGRGVFTARELYAFPSPSFGVSSLELVDFNGDGKLDLLFTTGDMFDGEYPRTNHGVYLLKNVGDLKYEHQMVAKMPGAMKATPLDADGDGDLDLVAVAMLDSGELVTDHFSELDSIILLINNGEAGFEHITLETSKFHHATCAAGDFDGDGDQDLAVGVFGWVPWEETTPRIDIWRNEGP